MTMYTEFRLSLFVPIGSEWDCHLSSKVTAPDSNNGSEYFGYSVSQSDDILAVGAYGDDDVYTDSGSAYWVLFGIEWDCHLSDESNAPDANNGSEYFGYSVSQSEDILAVGAYLDDDVYTDSGSAYLFRLESNGTATFLTKVTAPDPHTSDHFGVFGFAVEDIWRWVHIWMILYQIQAVMWCRLFISLEADGSVTFLTKNYSPRRIKWRSFWVSVSQSETFSQSVRDMKIVHTNSGAAYVMMLINFIPSNTPPSDILLSVSTLPENLPAGTVVGQLSTVDPDDVNSTGTYSFALVSGPGDTDNTQFTIDAGGTLSVNGTTDYESMIADPNATYVPHTDLNSSFANANYPANYFLTPRTQYPAWSIRVEVQDENNASFEKILLIASLDWDDTAPLITLGGNPTVSHVVTSAYTDGGATWTDEVDGNGSIPQPAMWMSWCRAPYIIL